MGLFKDKEYRGGEFQKSKYADVGGQAVIEGVMMRGKDHLATAVRLPSGEITVDIKENKSVLRRWKILKIPILRGLVSFFESMVVGMTALTYSADLQLEEETDSDSSETASNSESVKKVKAGNPKAENDGGSKIPAFVMFLTILVSLGFGVALFFFLPNFLVGLVKNAIPSNTLANLCEGLVRITIFVLYVLIVSQMKDIRRVFEYHGAEHKTIHCFEHGLPLTVDNIQRFSRLHPRCGTSFMLIVMVVSILFFSFLPWTNPIQRLFYRLLLLPVVAGISYEIIKFAGRFDNVITRIISFPGMCLQRLTTREPSGDQIEVAIRALEESGAKR